MLARLKKHTVPITIGVSFFVFGFFITANVLNLSEREIVIGLIAGSIGGITTLVAMLWQERSAIEASA
jgi:fluoride ion exporter CrcB/FEX